MLDLRAQSDPQVNPAEQLSSFQQLARVGLPAQALTLPLLPAPPQLLLPALPL